MARRPSWAELTDVPPDEIVTIATSTNSANHISRRLRNMAAGDPGAEAQQDGGGRYTMPTPSPAVAHWAWSETRGSYPRATFL